MMGGWWALPVLSGRVWALNERNVRLVMLPALIGCSRGPTGKSSGQYETRDSDPGAADVFVFSL